MRAEEILTFDDVKKYAALPDRERVQLLVEWRLWQSRLRAEESPSDLRHLTQIEADMYSLLPDEYPEEWDPENVI